MAEAKEPSRDEVIANLEQFQDDVKENLSNRSTQLKALIGGASSLGLLSSFLLGRRSGKRKSRPNDNPKK